MSRRRQLVFADRQGDAKSRTALVRGGKGAALVEMADLGLPIPPSFTISTGACRAFLEHGEVPKRLLWQLRQSMKELERRTSRAFGGIQKPLLVSVRSGAPVSMPGMMDTILNVGMNEVVCAALAAETDEVFAADCYRRLREMFRKVNPGKGLPDDPFEQLFQAIITVFQSWNSERARVYREAYKIPGWYGTAVTVQAMVFGNAGMDSCTGVVFSRNVSTGARGLYGEFLVNAQGEDVVSGSTTPLQISELRNWNAAVYEELERYSQKLESHYGDVVDIEFTVERGQLFILQSRVAKRTPEAAATIAVHQVWDGSWTKLLALQKIGDDTMERLRNEKRGRLTEEAVRGSELLGRGLPASAGVATGRMVFTSAEAVSAASQGEKVVLCTRDTSPDDLAGMLASVAIVTEIGGYTSHAAVVARGIGIPAVVGAGFSEHTLTSLAANNRVITVDGSHGVVLAGAVQFESLSKKEINLLLRWADQLLEHRLDFNLMNRQFSMNEVAADFYLSDALVNQTRGTSLHEEALQLRASVQTEAATLIATYLTIAVAGELRHAFSGFFSDAQPELAVLSSKFALRAESYRFEAQQRTIELLRTCKHGGHIEFLRLAVAVFSESGWNRGFGGMKWANIARAVQMYLQGAMNAVVFVDHAFDLEHNGGRLFDKHEMVANMTDEYWLRRQLNAKKVSRDFHELAPVFWEIKASGARGAGSKVLSLMTRYMEL